MPKLGCHVSIAGGASLAVERAAERWCETIQIFTTSPRAWKHQVHRAEEVAAFREGIARIGIDPVVVHASYLVNLASPRASLRRTSISLLAETAAWSSRLGASTIVVHVGRCQEDDLATGLRRAGSALAAVLTGIPRGVTLSLEMSAGGSGSVGGRFEHFSALLDEVHGDERIRVWLDTAHAYGAGFDLRIPDGLASLLAAVKRTVGWRRVAGVHANDSKVPLASKKDRHENLGEGHIGATGFRRMLRHPAFRGLPFILETPGFDGTGPDRRNMRRLYAWAGRRPRAAR